jgi:protein gp37
MSAGSKIEWLDGGPTWNVVVGCNTANCKASCYAVRGAHRMASNPHPAIRKVYEGLTAVGSDGLMWTGRARFVAERLAAPLGWKKPCRAFVTSMGDPCAPDITNEQLAAVFGVMAATPHITYLLATKQAERLAAWFEWIGTRPGSHAWTCVGYACAGLDSEQRRLAAVALETARVGAAWPLPNVIPLASCCDQADLDRQVPRLLRCPGVKGLSLEPLLAPVDLGPWIGTHDCRSGHSEHWRGFPDQCDACEDGGRECAADPDKCEGRGLHCPKCGSAYHVGPIEEDVRRRNSLDWIAVGPETGPGRRPCDPAWLRSVAEQCSAAGVGCYVKKVPVGDRLVADPTSPGWPAWAVREFPTTGASPGGERG